MFILASSSPRRKELLKRLVSNFTVIVPKINENIKVAEKEYLPLEIAKLKAYAIFSLYPEDTVLASDTIVIYENEVLGKPKNIEDARRMLHLLSGKKHQVITAYTLISPKKEVHRQVTTDVYFNHLSEQLIEDYLVTGSCLDKAGAYGIQDQDFPLVHHISGSYSNVMGLPLEMLEKDLKDF